MLACHITEAREFLALARRGGEPIEAIRAQIGRHSHYRREVLAHFDRMCSHRKPAVSEKQKIVIVRLLVRGWTHTKIRERFDVSVGVIRRLSKRSGAATLRPRHGRNGRKLTNDAKQRIRAAAQAGKQPMEIAREFSISCAWALQYCRAAGYVNRSYPLKWSDEKIAECELALRGGAEWRQVARDNGIPLQTLLARIAYRKKGDDHGKRRNISAVSRLHHSRLRRNGRTPERADDCRTSGRTILQRLHTTHASRVHQTV